MSIAITSFNRFAQESVETHERPYILVRGIAFSVLLGVGLFSFLRELPGNEFISTYGVFFLLQYDGLVTQSIVSLTLTLAFSCFALGYVLYPDEPTERGLLGARLLGVTLLFVVVYFVSTYPDTASYIHDKKIFDKPLEHSEWLRVFYSGDLFLLCAMLAVNNTLMGVASLSINGDFFTTSHYRHFFLNLIPASLGFMTALPLDVVHIEGLPFYIGLTAALYGVAFVLSLHLEEDL